MSRLHLMKIEKIPVNIIPGYVSNRAETRHSKILKKTAKALGRSWEPVGSWGTRNQGIKSAKQQAARDRKSLGKAAVEAVKGDRKKVSGTA